ncbi:MAG: sulfatase-like hydrolase/transferase [Phycisphaeraceae bacterium]
MPTHPNILFLMTDQMQGRVLEPGHPCLTPNLDRLVGRGVRITRAYTPNAVCSPARASLMTGRLPHSHNVLDITHGADDDQHVLRTSLPHFAQHLQAAGYRTGYFGKWHVERTDALDNFGWQDHALERSPRYNAVADELAHKAGTGGPGSPSLPQRHVEQPAGYKRSLLYAVTNRPAFARPAGVNVELAHHFLTEHLAGDAPWCCCVSVIEPHDPFVASHTSYDKYDVDAIDLPANFADTLADKPGLYRKAARAWHDLTDHEKRQAIACYWASITDLDEQFGRLLDLLEERSELDNTLVVLTSDHGELLGAHQLYCKNTGAFEEAYHIPMVVAGPTVTRGQAADARVGLHDLAPTLCELAGAQPMTSNESRSFASLLRDPATEAPHWQTGYAEFYGTRYYFTQRILWDGPWKLVFNGFDEDELYNLDDDPGEMHNLAHPRQPRHANHPAHRAQHERMMRLIWQRIKDTGDHALANSFYPAIRYAIVGPDLSP